MQVRLDGELGVDGEVDVFVGSQGVGDFLGEAVFPDGLGETFGHIARRSITGGL